MCAHAQRRRKNREATQSSPPKLKQSPFPRGGSVLCFAVGEEVGLVLRSTTVHSMGEMVPCIQTYATICCDVFPVAEGQSISISASALQCTALTGLSLSETYDALMTPPRDDKQLKSLLYLLDTWHIKPCSKQHVLAWEKAITTLVSHRAQLLILCLHLPYCY